MKTGLALNLPNAWQNWTILGSIACHGLTPTCQSQRWLSWKTYKTPSACGFLKHLYTIKSNQIYSVSVFPSNSGQVSNARRVSDGTRAGRPAHERPTCGQLSPQPNNLDDFEVPNSISKPQVQLKIFQLDKSYRLYTGKALMNDSDTYHQISLKSSQASGASGLLIT